MFRSKCCISGEENSTVYRCIYSKEHEFCISDKEFNKLKNKMINQKSGNEIIIKNFNNETIIKFRNMIRTSNKDKLNNKNLSLCLNCLNESKKSNNSIERFLKAYPKENDFSEKKKIKKK